MGFKADASFLRYLTMGAIGVRQVMNQLQAAGFAPIELERYCGSNKIWATKVKRLRLPDLLCTKTGLRVEVRAKSDLKVRMSDAPANPERTWDAGLRDDDLVGFIACFELADDLVAPADKATFFTVESLRLSMPSSKLGPPKSASEGAERDRTWPVIVPTRNGRVTLVGNDRISVEMESDPGTSRKQSYNLKGKSPYVIEGEYFTAGVSILAGSPASVASLSAFKDRSYDAVSALKSPITVDRYAAIKAIPKRPELHQIAGPEIEKLISAEHDQRVALEAAGSAVALNLPVGLDYIAHTIKNSERGDLKMEAVFILTELGGKAAEEQLTSIARDESLNGSELRQAAVWGLGKSGLRSYSGLVQFIDDESDDVALHAIVAFGHATPAPDIDALITKLRNGNSRTASAASAALAFIESDAVLTALAAESTKPGKGYEWILATLGRLDPHRVEALFSGQPILDQLAPIQALSPGKNWLARPSTYDDLLFLQGQNI